MKDGKQPAWLTIAAVLAAVFGNGAVLMLIFRIRGILFLPALLLYLLLLCLGSGWMLRKRDLQRLSNELQITEEEVRELLRKAKKQKRKQKRQVS